MKEMQNMSLRYSCLMMFFGSFIIQYFIMSSIMVYKFEHIRFSLGKFYMSIIMALLMVLLEILMHDIYYKHFSYNYYIIDFILLGIIIFLYKKQIFINEKEYLKEMIEHHSMVLLTSNKIKDKTNNQEINKLANNILNTQQKEIKDMNNLIKYV
jgi:hypothetical protein